MTGWVTGDLLRRVRDRLTADGSEPTPAAIAAAVRAEAGGVVGDAELLRVLHVLDTEFRGAGVLDAVLREPGVTDVLVSRPDEVWVDRGRGLERADVRFDDDAAVRRLAGRLAVAAGRRLDDAQPWVDGRLPGVDSASFGVRLHAVLAPVARRGTCLSLRVLRPASQGLGALASAGTFADGAEDLVRRIVSRRVAFLVVGGTGTGKTTLLAALLGEVDPRERIVCVEDAAELAPAHPHVVTLVARPANVEGVGEVTVRDLVRQALRMRPDRIVVGEVRGPEVVDLLTALNTGHDGGAGTVHANSPEEVPARLEALAALGGLSRAALHSQLAAAVHVVLHTARLDDGRRVLASIGVVTPGDDGVCRVLPAWSRDAPTGPGRARLQELLGSEGAR